MPQTNFPGPHFGHPWILRWTSPPHKASKLNPFILFESPNHTHHAQLMTLWPMQGLEDQFPTIWQSHHGLHRQQDQIPKIGHLYPTPLCQIKASIMLLGSRQCEMSPYSSNFIVGCWRTRSISTSIPNFIALMIPGTMGMICWSQWSFTLSKWSSSNHHSYQSSSWELSHYHNLEAIQPYVLVRFMALYCMI